MDTNEKHNTKKEIPRKENTVHAKMPVSRRAKQFMPFAALKGYMEALRMREKIVVERRELSEEYKEELDRKLRQVRKNDIVTVVYFCNGEYPKMTGMVSKVDETARVLKVVNTKIKFEDLYEVEGGSAM